MTVDPGHAAGSHAHGGKIWYFCSRSCLEKFQADPARYTGDKPATVEVHAAPSASPAEYTCPMHPQIVQSGPGTCPICGMALEPRVVSADEQENPELADMRRRFWISVVLTAPILFTTMGGRRAFFRWPDDDLDPVPALDAGSRLGRVAIL